jgi:hypothetical protein
MGSEGGEYGPYRLDVIAFYVLLRGIPGFIFEETLYIVYYHGK